MATLENNTTLNGSIAKENNESIELKAYKTPKLTNYGDISELVLAMGGIGTDGFPIPTLSLT